MDSYSKYRTLKVYINLIWTCRLNFKIKRNNILRRKLNSSITKIIPFRVCKEISRRKFNHFKENSSCWNPPPWWKLITHVCKLCWWHLVAVVIGIKYPNIHERRFSLVVVISRWRKGMCLPPLVCLFNLFSLFRKEGKNSMCVVLL